MHNLSGRFTAERPNAILRQAGPERTRSCYLQWREDAHSCANLFSQLLPNVNEYSDTPGCEVDSARACSPNSGLLTT